MNKKALDEKYSYQIDEHNIVHLFRGEVECQEFLTNSLLSAIFKIETLEKENAELKENNQFLNNLVKEKEQRGFEVQEDLLKEIVELKRDKEDLIFVRNQKADYINELEDQLTNAKEIIREYKNICNNAPFLDEKEVELKEQADQFLSEVEK